MNQVSTIKRFVLRALLQMQGTPMPGDALDSAVMIGVAPRPVLSDVELAKRSLEADGFILGTKDELDESTTWALTTRGELKAKQL